MEYDIIIIGAGPAGCSLALHLANTDIKIALIDKESFPRRKVCGGALSERALNQLKAFPKGLNIYQNFLNSVNKIKSYGLRVNTPNKKILEFDFKDPKDKDKIPGFLCRRSDFDNFMINEVKKYSNIELITETKINSIDIENDKIIANSKDHTFTSKFIVGADGANSILRKNFPSFRKVSDIGVSTHYENVSGFHDDNLIDMYFLKETLPGYFWIFKLPDNQANVGVYTTKENLQKNKRNLRSMLKDIISEHPEISIRFKNAKQLDEVKGWKLPILFRKVFNGKNLYGKRHLFIGDAASLIDPITGEGIGNALVSSNYAAEAIKSVFKNGNFDYGELDVYRRLLVKKFRYELIIHTFSRILFRNSIVLETCFSLIKNLKYFNAQISKRLYKH
ncbi:MAG: geranylgeranyl reductase family protein [Candidatus Pacebacteria bacterium]|nr:geranylgeranyl reductase family protein [Candidatus Paceibacterota bacterium]